MTGPWKWLRVRREGRARRAMLTLALVNGEVAVCPRCERSLLSIPPLSKVAQIGTSEGWWPDYPATSRMDNTTYVCSECGLDEAIRNHLGAPPLGLDDWGKR